MDQRNQTAPPYFPFGTEEADQVYNELFADDPEHFNTSQDVVQLHSIVDNPDLSTPRRLLAYKQLAAEGAAVGARELLGVIVEIGMDGAVEIVAALEDGTVTIISPKGQVIQLKDPDVVSDEYADPLLDAAIVAVNKWPAAKPPRQRPPAEGSARISLLVADKVHIKQGSFMELEADATAGPILQHAAALLQWLISDAG
ncbi:hypothetical protein JMG10_20110 [Nostoc ellipsosporum NOK]|nr:hypothetical protein [Nostoc ellipsosporum NOK]